MSEAKELAGLYAADTGLPEVVCLALIRNDIEPTRAMFERVTRIGYSAAEVNMFNPLLTNPNTEELSKC